jgi:hypothetical protein
MWRMLIILTISTAVLYCGLLQAQNTPCQTPDQRGLIIFEPAQWQLNVHGSAAYWTMELGDYGEPFANYEYRAQVVAPNPSQDTTCNLQAFLSLMQFPDIGILFISSHAGPYGIAMEFHADSVSRDSALHYYLDSLHIQGQYLTAGMTSDSLFYSIGLSYQGIQHFCTNLSGALVYAWACSSSWFNSAWGAKIVLGWDRRIWNDCYGERSFFNRMLGRLGRRLGNTNWCREAHDAASQIECPSPQGGMAHLICYQNDQSQCDIVLSPIVLEHQPGFVVEGEISLGSILFDCVMQPHQPAIDLIDISGPPGIQIQRVYWDSDHELRFVFDPVAPDCWIDFRINPEYAVSANNESQLDGNTNPAAQQRKNGVAPNQDFYNWTCSEHIYRFIDFENEIFSGLPIGTTIPGLDFSYPSVPWNYVWTYMEPTPNSTVYPYHYGSIEPVYWFDGRFAAWIGEQAPEQREITTRIYFNHGTASMICMGYTSCWWLYVRAYNTSSVLINQIMVYPHANWEETCPPGTYGLGQITIAPDEEHLGQRIYYIEIQGDQNTFAIDNLIVYDFLQEGFAYLPPGYDPKLQEIEEVQPGNQPNVHTIEVDNNVDSLRIICYWDSEKDPGIRLEVRDPNDNLVFQKDAEQKPILVPPISEPVVGTWKINISSLKSEGKAYPYSIIGALGYKILVDCYIEPSDISFDPAQPDSGQNVWISAKVHAGDQYSKPVEDVLVRCYLGEPDSTNKIGRDAYALYIPPDSTQTVNFYINSSVCQGSNPCKIYIALDPKNQLEEYNETNNVAFKELTFTP